MGDVNSIVVLPLAHAISALPAIAKEVRSLDRADDTDVMEGFDKPEAGRNALEEEHNTRKLYGWF